MDLIQKSFPVIQQHEILEQAVNARELHEFLEVGKDFSNWIKGRISKHDFIEGVDFIRVAKNGVGTNQGFQAIEYFITVTMAKELAMVENNKHNKAVRKYFIECERQAKQANNEVGDIAEQHIAESQKLYVSENKELDYLADSLSRLL